MLITGLDCRYEGDISGIPGQWHQFVPHLDALPGRRGHVTYGVSHRMDETSFHYLAGVEVASSDGLPEGFTLLPLPAQRYAVFPHEGPVWKLPETCAAIGAWFRESGREAVDAPVMLERYGENFCPDTGRDIEVWFPVR
jgi:AraC family transcriptional regulator